MSTQKIKELAEGSGATLAPAFNEVTSFKVLRSDVPSDAYSDAAAEAAERIALLLSRPATILRFPKRDNRDV